MVKPCVSLGSTLRSTVVDVPTDANKHRFCAKRAAVCEATVKHNLYGSKQVVFPCAYNEKIG